MKGPKRFAEFLNVEQYHPRSDAHSNAICRLIVEDLIEFCPPFADRAAAGKVVAKVNLTQTVGHTDWTIDLAVGPPASAAQPPRHGDPIRIERPAIIQIALEAKGVMTEHGKARLNRLRDLQAFHDHAHRYNPKTIAVGIVVVNVSPIYWSPTRDQNDITEHKNISQIGRKTVDTYRNLPLRIEPSDGPGFEAVSVIVVSHDNLQKNPEIPHGFKSRPTKLVTTIPAPQVGDPLNYAFMIHRVCESYTSRFL